MNSKNNEEEIVILERLLILHQNDLLKMNSFNYGKSIIQQKIKYYKIIIKKLKKL